LDEEGRGNQTMDTKLKKVFFAAGAGWAFDAMDVGLLAFIMVALTKEWGLSPEQVGLLGSISLLGMAIGAVAGGYLADRIGRKTIFISTLLIFGLASGASTLATGLAGMMVFRFIMGLGLGAELPVASTMVMEHAPESKRGRIVVLLESFWAVGWIVAAVIAFFVIPKYGWQAAVLIGAAPAVYAALMRKKIPESPKYQQKTTQSVSLGEIFSSYRRNTLVLWTVWFAIAFSYYGMFLWLPSVMVGKGFTMIKSFEYVLMMTLAQLPGYFSAAYVIEKWGRKKTLVIYLLGTALSAFMFGFSETTAMLLTAGALLSFFNLGAWGALYAFTPENYPTPVRASGSGFAAGFGRIGSILPPYIVGTLIASQYSYGVIFSVFAVVLMVGVIVMGLFGKETMGQAVD
jgi:putative MFS transporter